MEVATRSARVLAGLVLVLAITIPAGATGGPDAARVPALHWQPCDDLFPGADCATANVPLDYNDPTGPTIPIALGRIKATDQAHRIGTLFVNPGGPGGPGLDLVFNGFASFFAAQLKGRFDVVGFDPRGVGASAPLHCFANEDQLFTFLGTGPVFPYQADQQAPYFRRFSSLADRCFRRGKPIVNHMSTADVVRDLDLLRRAVGDDALNFFGYSYGSFIGNTYANMFPDKVRALVIDGVLDPRKWASGQQIVSDRVASAQELREILRLCDKAGPDWCALAGRKGGAAKRYLDLVAALRDEPLIFDDGFAYSYDFLISDTVDALHTPEFWPDYASFFAFVADAVLGDAEATRQARASRQSIREQLKGREPTYPNFFDSYYGNQCADTQYPHTLTKFSEGDAFAGEGSIFGPYWWWQNSGCASWPVSPDRYAGPWQTETSAPVLVVGNFFDGVTAYTGAVASSKLLTNSRLLSYAGWGHTAFGRSECVTRKVANYVLRGTLPAPGTVCPANPNPFLAVTLQRAGPAVPLIGLPRPMPGLRKH